MTRRSTLPRPGTRLVAAGLALGIVLTGCGSQPSPDEPASNTTSTATVDGDDELAGDAHDGSSDDGATSEPPTDPPVTAPAQPDEPEDVSARSTIARAEVGTVEVFEHPGDDVPIHRMDHPREVGAPLTFLVDRRDGDWLEVLLPVRPNGSTGWIRRDDVSLVATPLRVEVELSAHRLTVHDGDDVRIETPIGVGGDGTPTPPGRYYITELLRPPDPGGPYGPYAFGLSGFSEVHLDFAGGEGVIGIHGTSEPDSIGRDSSNGCIRVANDVISDLATFLPLGTPVDIIA